MNIMEDASSLGYGCLVHYYCLWYISIHHAYTSNFAEGKWFVRDCLHKGRVPKLAGLLTPWVKEVFIYYFQITYFFHDFHAR